MKISMFTRFLFCAFVAIALSLTAVAQTASGQIKAAKVEGLVTKISANGTSTPLKSGDSLTETDAVVTGKGASVVMVFANGSSVKVGSESRLSVDEFKMDPLAEDIKFSELKAEPAVSQTKLNLAYGEMVGDVKKLNKSSSYSIKTPVGAAGIRGTIYRIVFTPSSDGRNAFFTVTTVEGLVVMEGVAGGDVNVPADKEVVVEIDTDNPNNPSIVTQDIPASTKAQIQTEAAAITQAVIETVIPPVTPSVTTPPPPPEPPPVAPEPPQPNIPPVPNS